MQKQRSVFHLPVLLLISGCLCTPAFADEATYKLLGDYQQYVAGSYAAYVAPFNKGDYVYGRDYVEGIRLTLPSFPGQTMMGWNWPNTPCTKGVYDFISLAYGNYYDTIVPVPIPVRQLSAIHTLSETHDAAYSGMLEGFDVIDDMFLTTEAGNHKTHAFEVEVFLHTPGTASAFVQRSKRVGTFTGSGINWTVAVSPGTAPDILFMPADKADVASGTVDLKAMLDYLVAQGTIPGTVYFNGFAFGTETTQGSGAMKVNAFSVIYN